MYILYFKIILLLILSMNFGYSKVLIPCLGDIKTGKPTYILKGQNTIIGTQDFVTGRNRYLYDQLKFRACEEEENMLKHFNPSNFRENMNLEKFLINNEGATDSIKKFLSDNPEYLESSSHLALALNTEAKEFEEENGAKYYEVNFEVGRKKTRNKKFTSIYQEKKIYRFYFYEMEIGRSDEEIQAANDREIYRLRHIKTMKNHVKEFRNNYETTEHRNKRVEDLKEYSKKRRATDKTNDEEGTSKKREKTVGEENSEREEVHYVSSGKFEQDLKDSPEINRETMERLNFLINLF